MTDFAPAAAGLRAAVGELLAMSVGAVRTRLQLAVNDVEEEQLRLAGLLAHALMALFLLFAGVLLALAWLVLAVDAAHRVATLGALALLFAGGSLVAVLRLRRRIASKPPLLQATLAELERDCEALLGQRSA
jgi:uncharacterized membrane protein YqjE